MSSAERYVIYTKVKSVEESFEVFYSIDPDNQTGPMLRERGKSTGWWVHFEGSRELICFGPDKPNFVVGDEVKISFEKRESER